MRLFYIICVFLCFLQLPAFTDLYFKYGPVIITTVMLFYINAKFPIIRRLKIGRLAFWLFLFCLLIVYAALNTGNPNSSIGMQVYKSLNLLLIVYLSFYVGKYYMNRHNSDSKRVTTVFFEMLYYPASLYFMLNLFLWFLGINSLNDTSNYEIESSALLLSKVGILADRAMFPLVTGSNSFAGLVGLVILIGIIYQKYSGNYKQLVTLFQIVNVLVLLLSDSRAALLVLSITFVFVLYLKRFNAIRILWALPVLAIVSPIIFPFVLDMISSITILQVLERTQGDLESGNSRLFINLISISEFTTFQNIHLLGYGEFGHYTSGKSLLWSSIFNSSDINSELKSPHSTVLSILFDIGYIGLMAYLGLLLSSIYIISKTWHLFKSLNLIIVGYLVYFVLMGMSETYYGFYAVVPTYHFFIMLSFQLVLYYSDKISSTLSR